MATWTKKKFDGGPVTEWTPGPNFRKLQASMSGAVVLALDVSGSMSGSRIEQAKRGCRGFIDEAIADGYSVGMILWHHGVAASVPISLDGRESYELVDSARASGGNAIVPTLQESHQMLMDEPVGDRVLAIFGDGDLGSVEAAIAGAEPLIADGIRIITCGLGPESARRLAVISTEKSETDTPRTAESDKIEDAIVDMSSGLVRGRR